MAEAPERRSPSRVNVTNIVSNVVNIWEEVDNKAPVSAKTSAG
jgi:hypothetical protein